MMLVAAQVASVLIASVGVTSALQFTTQTQQEAGVYWMRLHNTGDVQYTGLLRVGGQQVKAIIDTGSFELLVFGVNCTKCGSQTHLYDGSKSRDYNNDGFLGSHSFGSGTTYAVEAKDRLQIGTLKIPTQMFWEVTDADMPLLSEDSFQAILGVGPPSSIVSFAEEEVEEVHKELKQYKKGGNKVTDNVKQIVQHYDEKVQHAKNLTTVAENLALQNMAICLKTGSGSHGYFLWNDRRVVDMPRKFTEIAVAGESYWSANLSKVKLGAAPLVGNVSKKMKKAAKAKSLGCHSENCSAVIDTGTSLIVAPTEIVENVVAAMRDWIEAGGTCDDLSKLPDLEFRLNGKQFSLPPEAYVGVMVGDLGEDMKGFMPHLYQERHRKVFETVECQPLLMTMDADSQFGPLWILGMPFFRKYYTNFRFIQNIGKLSMPLAHSMSFSVADSMCRPGRSPEDAAKAKKAASLFERRTSKTPRQVQLRVDASKIRISPLAHKIRAKALGLATIMLNKPHVRI